MTIAVTLGSLFLHITQSCPGEPDRHMLLSELEAEQLEQPLKEARQRMHARSIATEPEQFEKAEGWDGDAQLRKIGAARVGAHPSKALIDAALRKRDGHV